MKNVKYYIHDSFLVYSIRYHFMDIILSISVFWITSALWKWSKVLQIQISCQLRYTQSCQKVCVKHRTAKLPATSRLLESLKLFVKLTFLWFEYTFCTYFLNTQTYTFDQKLSQYNLKSFFVIDPFKEAGLYCIACQLVRL